MNDYGQPDPGLNRPVGYGDAWTTIAPPPKPTSADPSPGFTANPYAVTWRNTDGIGDYYYQKKPGEYALAPDYVRNSSPLLSAGRINAQRELEKEKRGEGKLAAINAEAGRRYDLERSDRNTQQGVENQYRSDSLAATIGYQQGSLANQTQELKNSLKIQEATLAQRGKESADANELSRLQLGLQSTQMSLTNNLAERKMTLEAGQFDRQMAMDEKTNRRTKVMGALTLIAQSAARL